MTTMRKANATDIAAHREAGGLYPLGYVAENVLDQDGKPRTCLVEDLRGHWSRPDPVWEIRAPRGFHFHCDHTHGLLEQTLADVRAQLTGRRLEACTVGCGCGCEYDANERDLSRDWEVQS